MKIEDFTEVSKCVTILERIQRAKNKILNCEDEVPDPGGIPGIADQGYGCHISKCEDGSGSPVNLAGCYVGNEVYDAVYNVLLTKEQQIKHHLQKLGVDVGNFSEWDK